MSRETELKPCPFCGGDARQYEGQTRYHGVACRKCTCNIYGYASRGAAKRAWNRRADNEQREITDKRSQE